MISRVAALALLLPPIGCSRYYKLPPTHFSTVCWDECTFHFTNIGRDNCLANCPGAVVARDPRDDFSRSVYTGLPQVVDDEDKLRMAAGFDLKCPPRDLTVVAKEGAEIPGWAADVTGCGKTAVYKIAGRDGWAKQ